MEHLPQPAPLAALVLMGLTGVAIFHVGLTYAMADGSAAQGAIVFALVPAAVMVAAVVGLANSACTSGSPTALASTIDRWCRATICA